MLRNCVNLRTFFNHENWLADENRLFSCLQTSAKSQSFTFFEAFSYCRCGIGRPGWAGLGGGKKSDPESVMKNYYSWFWLWHNWNSWDHFLGCVGTDAILLLWYSSYLPWVSPRKQVNKILPKTGHKSWLFEQKFPVRSLSCGSLVHIW